MIRIGTETQAENSLPRALYSAPRLVTMVKMAMPSLRR